MNIVTPKSVDEYLKHFERSEVAYIAIKLCKACKTPQIIFRFIRGSTERTTCNRCYLRRKYQRAMAEAQGKKYCPRCNAILDINKFSLNKNRPDGLQSYCKSCMSEVRRKT